MILTMKQLPERREWDHYPTDEGTVRRCLELVRFNHHREYPVRVLDPGAGDGVWGRVLREFYPRALITGVEVRPSLKPESYDHWVVADFLAWAEEHSSAYDLILGNPPYGLAEEFVRAGAALQTPRGEMLFLLRLAFLESVKRRDGLFRDLPPAQVAVCSKRPSFSGDGRTNATAFAAFLWGYCKHDITTLSWLE